MLSLKKCGRPPASGCVVLHADGPRPICWKPDRSRRRHRTDPGTSDSHFTPKRQLAGTSRLLRRDLSRLADALGGKMGFGQNPTRRSRSPMAARQQESFSLYMFHGGRTRLHRRSEFRPTPTSRTSPATIMMRRSMRSAAEAKYAALKELFHAPTPGVKLPDLPAPLPPSKSRRSLSTNRPRFSTISPSRRHAPSRRPWSSSTRTTVHSLPDEARRPSQRKIDRDRSPRLCQCLCRWPLLIGSLDRTKKKRPSNPKSDPPAQMLGHSDPKAWAGSTMASI